jgi:cytidine deaminase
MSGTHHSNAPVEEKVTAHTTRVQDFINDCRELAFPPISGFSVSIAGELPDRSLLPGVNIEFKGSTLNESIHAEQTLLAVAHSRGAVGLDTIYFEKTAPCGHCRQFLHELGSDPELIILDRPPKRLSFYLPDAFGPRDLGFDGGLLSHPPHNLVFFDSDKEHDSAAQRALESATRAYAPYSRAYAGVVLTLESGEEVAGSYLENAAFNPSLSPFHVALANLIADKRASFDTIRRVTLARLESKAVDHFAPIHRLLPLLGVMCEVRDIRLIQQ